MKRIGIDATALPSEPVGAGNYILRLIRSLARVNEDYELVIFAQQSGQKQIGHLPSRLVAWEITPDRSVISRLAWEQLSLSRLAQRCRLDLLHSLHYTRPLFLPCKSVVTFHDMTFFLFPELHTRARRIIFPQFIRYSALHSQQIIAVSENTRQDALRLLPLAPERIHTTPLGIAPEFTPLNDPQHCEEVRARYQLPARFVLFVGLVEPRKNLPLLLRAFARIAPAAPDTDLVIVGRLGWMYDEVFELIETLNIKERVHFPGYVPQIDLPMVYNLAQIFVYPSRYEGFGLPPLEAMACGAPVITTAVSSMLELVGDGGLLVPPDDETALAEAMHTLLADESARRELGQKGRRRAQSFTWEQTAHKTLSVYHKALQTS
jgi:glycosyltransferase involved in cell wall biosynthesis